MALLAPMLLALGLGTWKVVAAPTPQVRTAAPAPGQPTQTALIHPASCAVTTAASTASGTGQGISPVSPDVSSTSSGGDWILAPDNPPPPRTLGDIPPLPVAHSSHDPGFHPVQVQKRETNGDTIILTCLNPTTNKTEVIVGKSGRDTIFTIGNPTGKLRTGVIQNVQLGDLVPTRNSETGKIEFKRVTQTFKHMAHETITTQLADAVTGKVVDSLTATPEHPFFVPGRGAIPLGQLGIGTQVVTRAGPPLVIASLVKHEYPQGIPVYNFEVQGDHTYFVGVANGGTWVHNCGNLPESAWRGKGKAPWQVEPGTKSLEGEYINDFNGRVEPWQAHYDEYGRQVGRTDFNAGNKAAGHPDIHYHTYGYNNGVRYPIADHVPGIYTPQ